MPREPVTSKELREIAERLRITRDAFGYTQGFISRLIGSTTESGQAWENYESGRRRISLNHAMALCRKCGLTLDRQKPLIHLKITPPFRAPRITRQAEYTTLC